MSEDTSTEKQDNDLEQILEAFDQVKGTFNSPRTLSYEHDDVTVKYWNSMLKIAEEKGVERESVVNSFCERFEANQEQMKSLLSDKHNWVDFNLYHAFAAHCQQQLGMDTETFWQETADKTFQDYSDEQIKAAENIPLRFVIMGMNTQFKNWSKVNTIKVEKLKRSRHSHVIKKNTTPEAKERATRLVGKEVLDLLLKRDDIYTHNSFTTTFKKLYNQPNLYLEQGQSEVDGNEWSEHFVHPSSPRKIKIVEKYYSFLSSLKNFGRTFKNYILPWSENKRLRNVEFKYEQTISARTRDLELANAKLERRQETIMDLLEDISEIRMTGERHGIRGTLDLTFKLNKKEIIENISQQVNFLYNHFKDNTEVYEFLVESCEPFKIKKEDLAIKKNILEQLKNINLKNYSTEPEEEISEEIIEDEEEDFDIFDEIISKDIDFDVAYDEFIKVKEKYGDTLTKNNLSNFDPFRLLLRLKMTQEEIGTINERIDKMSKVGFLDEVKLSEAVNEGINESKREKKSNINIITELNYDPIINTNRDALVYLIKDIVSNMIDHGNASEGTIISKSPKEIKKNDLEEKLPNYDHFNFTEIPILYLSFRDNGISITPEKADEINEYLSTGKGNTTEISSKKDKNKKSGLGTKNLYRISKLHNITIHYQPSSNGTTIDCYFDRLNI
jgi:signal transduction histidine kinase